MSRWILTTTFVLLAVCVSVAALGAEEATPALHETYRLMAHGEYQEAIGGLERLVDPADVEAAESDAALRAEALFLLGRAHELAGELDEALAAHQRVVDEFTESDVFANASLALAELSMRQEQPEQATHALQAALERGLSSDHAFRAHLYLAEALSTPNTAVEDLDRAVELFLDLNEKARKTGDVARINFGLGFCYQRKGVWKEAERHYVAVAEAAPTSLWAVHAGRQRIVHYRQERLGQDAAVLEKLLQRQQVVTRQWIQVGPRVLALDPIADVGSESASDEASAQRPPTEAVFDNAVFSCRGYRVTADTFSFKPPQRLLVGSGNVSLVSNVGAAKTNIRSTTVHIDLMRLRAAFSGNISYETASKAGGGKRQAISGLTELVIDLNSGWFWFRFAESAD